MGVEYIYGIPTPLSSLPFIFLFYNGLIFNDLAFSLCAKVKIKCLYINYLGVFHSYLPKRQKALILLIFCRYFLRLYIVSLHFRVCTCIHTCAYVRIYVRPYVYAPVCVRVTCVCAMCVRFVLSFAPFQKAYFIKH